MVKEDLWDLGEKWKTLSERPSKEARPDEAALDSTITSNTSTKAPAPKKSTTDPKVTTDTTPVETSAQELLMERMAGDKSIASFGDTFGRELDSDDERDAETAAEDAAKNQQEPSGTQFIFSPAQLEKDHKKALEGFESDGRSMSTAGKTTDSTRLQLKETREELQALKLVLQARDSPSKPKKSKKKKPQRPLPDMAGMDSAPIESERPLPDMAGMDSASIDEAEVITTVLQIVHDAKTTEPEEMETDAQILRAALSRKPKEAIQQDSDAMEEDEHGIIHIGSSQSSPSTDPSSPSSSSSSSTSSSESSSSSSSGESQDTQELLNKLRTNPYLPLSNIKSKNLTKSDRPGDSTSDSASHQSSGQDSGSTSGHLPVASSGNTGAVLDDAGDGD